MSLWEFVRRGFSGLRFIGGESRSGGRKAGDGREGRRRPQREYVSEFTRFMNEYLDAHPEVVADQRRGRAIYWDKQVDFKRLADAEKDSVPAESYYYFGWPGATRTARDPESDGPAKS